VGTLFLLPNFSREHEFVTGPCACELESHSSSAQASSPSNDTPAPFEWNASGSPTFFPTRFVEVRPSFPSSRQSKHWSRPTFLDIVPSLFLEPAGGHFRSFYGLQEVVRRIPSFPCLPIRGNDVAPEVLFLWHYASICTLLPLLNGRHLFAFVGIRISG